MTRKNTASARLVPPTREGARPRYGLLAASTAALVVACQPGSADQVTPPVDLGMTATTPPLFSGNESSLYEVQLPVALPVKKPSPEQVQSLGPTPANTPYTNAPWLLASDESVEIHYTISNVDAQDHTVWLLIDPWNEFVRWRPGLAVVSDEQTTPNYGYDLPFVVPAQGRIEGTITTDDMHEIAIKLASVMNVIASPQAQAALNPPAGQPPTFNTTGIVNNIFNPLNRSNGDDPLFTPWIPPVIAGITGFDLGLRYSGNTAANIAVEITIDVQDMNGNRFVAADSTDPQLGQPPTTLSPPGAM
jgi:hypothetical protein